jgi:hypothetical protein
MPAPYPAEFRADVVRWRRRRRSFQAVGILCPDQGEALDFNVGLQLLAGTSRSGVTGRE